MSGKTAVPRVVRKIKVDGKWIFAAVARKGDRLDYAHVVIRGKAIAAREGTFYLDFYENGRRRRAAIGDDQAAVQRTLAAQTHVLELRRLGVAADDAAGLHRPAEGKLLAELLRAYEASPPARLRERTQAKYLAILRAFVAWAHGQRITHAPMVTQAVMDRYIRHLRGGRGASPKTLNFKLVFLAGHLTRHGAQFNVKAADLPRAVRRQERPVYSAETLRALFAAASPAETLLFQTFLLTGMREQEIAHLTDRDLNIDRSTIRVSAKPEFRFLPKNYCERSVSVPRRLLELLVAQMNGRKGLIFGTAENSFNRTTGGRPDTNVLLKLKRLAKRAGLNCGQCKSTDKGKPVTCRTHPVCEQFFLHKFRHTYATRMLRDGMDVESLRQQLGHADLASTLIYLHALDAEELEPKVAASSLAGFL